MNEKPSDESSSDDASNVLNVNFRKRPPPPTEPPPASEPPERWHWQPDVIILMAGLGLMVATGQLVKSYYTRAPAPAATPLPTTLTVETGPNESHIQQLEDGTVVSLGALSKLHIRFTEKSRTVQQIGGEITFDVAEDVAARPFVVSTFLADMSQGSKFTVAVGPTVSVAVHSGSVHVRKRGSKSDASVEVKAGSTYRILLEAVADAWQRVQRTLAPSA